MAQELEVNSVTVSDLLEKLRSREWMIPAFQRDFVWTVGDVSALVNSILERRPIGMATLWHQPDENTLHLEPVSIRDRDRRALLTGSENSSNTTFAILDGRQRCTAIAIAFGGLQPLDRRMKFNGRFFLNLTEHEDSRRIEYVAEKDVLRRGLDSDSGAIGKGMFPMSSSVSDETLMQQWFRYNQAIKDPSNYPNSELPGDDELSRRNDILARSFEGVLTTKLAVNIVPSSYSLAEICEIFEVLNTRGTKVSTVDLIHSWLFADTSRDGSPILLREWIDKLGEQAGAVGWASSSDRPELIAQMTTASYISLDSRPDPRRVGGAQQVRVTSVKSGDLLSTPTLHWKHVVKHEQDFLRFLSDFQMCVAGGAFGWQACPYPVTASIYVGLRWHHHFDDNDTRAWDLNELDALFRGFFWRNSLSSRYDQGYVAQFGTDVEELKKILNLRANYPTLEKWGEAANRELDRFMKKNPPSTSELLDLCTDRQNGALQKALLLPIVARSNKDLLQPGLDISFPSRTDIQLHHIYPQAWCRNNRTGELSEWLDQTVATKNWVGSAANLMPLSRESNLEWRAENPSATLHRNEITYESRSSLFNAVFIDETSFEHLANGASGIPDFWTARASALAQYLESLLDVTKSA